MPDSYSILKRIASYLIAFVAAQSLLFGTPKFNGSFVEDHADFNGFYQGAITPTRDNGAVLNGALSEPSLEVPATTAIVRFDGSGEIQWGVSMKGFLTPDFAGGDEFFASQLEQVDDSLSIKLAKLNGPDLSQKFGYKIPLDVESITKVWHEHHQFGATTLVQDFGTSLHVLVIDEQGQTLFEKDYASTDFLPEDTVSGGTSVPTNISFQAVQMFQLQDSTGFYIYVQVSESDLSNPLSPTSENVFFAMKVSNSGEIQWKNKFSLTSASIITSVNPRVSADGRILYALNENVQSFELVGLELTITEEKKTYLVMIDSDGTLAFSKTIPNMVRNGFASFDGADNFYLSGATAAFGEPANSFPNQNVAFLRVNMDSGAIVSQIAMDLDYSSNADIQGLDTGDLFGTIYSHQGTASAPTTSTLFRISRSLESPIATVFSKEDAYGIHYLSLSDDESYFTVIDPSSRSIEAYSLDDSLVQIDQECDLFTPTTLSTYSPGLATIDFPLTLEDFPVTVTDRAFTLNPTTMPVQAFEIIELQCGETIQIPVTQSLLSIDEHGAQSGGNSITLTWPANSSEWVLEGASSLNAVWTTILSSEISTNGENFEFTVSFDNDFRFFRLEESN